MSNPGQLWSQIIGNTSKTGLLYMAMRHTAHTLSDMLGRPLTLKDLRLKTRSISQMMIYGDDPEA